MDEEAKPPKCHMLFALQSGAQGHGPSTRNTLALYNDDQLPAKGERATPKEQERWVGREEAVQPKGMVRRSLYHAFNLKDTPRILILVKMAEVS